MRLLYVDRVLKSFLTRHATRGKHCDGASRSRLITVVHTADLVSLQCKQYVQNGWNLTRIICNITFQGSNGTILNRGRRREALQRDNVKEKKGTILLNYRV